jgi:hypothetical protein
VNALGENMTINTNPAGRLAEFFKTTRKDTGADILVNSGIKKIKTGKDNVEMVALYRASSSTSKFAMIKNAFLGRTPADRNDVLTLLKSAGMSDKQADSALDKISLVGGHYSAKSVRETINKFQFEDTQGKVTVHPLPESPNTVDS